MPDKLTFADASAAVLQPYLPVTHDSSAASAARPFVTLTFATSLDSQLSLAPGVRTRLSGPESKAMTHFLRSKHAAILIGVSTLLADDPGLNCRISGASSQPRPIIIDPYLRWKPSRINKVLELCRDGEGLAPFVLTASDESDIPEESLQILSEHGGKFIRIQTREAPENFRHRFDWNDILSTLHAENLNSVMVEGGGNVINSLLDLKYQSLVDSVIVTIAPTWLGEGGVVVSPPRAHDEESIPIPAARLSNVKWHPFGEDVVLCGNFQQ